MCLAQRRQHSDAGEAKTRNPSVKHSTTEPLRSQYTAYDILVQCNQFLYDTPRYNGVGKKYGHVVATMDYYIAIIGK